MKMPRPVDAPRPSLRDARPVLLRVGTALGIAIGFLWVTSRIDPEPSSAQFVAPQSESAQISKSKSLGSFEGRDHTIRIVATPDGPRYTITDPHGVIIADKLTKDEVYERFPTFQLDTMTAGPLMMAPPDSY